MHQEPSFEPGKDKAKKAQRDVGHDIDAAFDNKFKDFDRPNDNKEHLDDVWGKHGHA